MKGLTYGVRPEPWTPPDDGNPLLVGLSKTPMRLEEREEPHPSRPGWVMARTRLTGICGSDAKQVFMDFGENFTDSALNGYFTAPTVLGHEVVAEVAELVPHVPDRVFIGQGVSMLRRLQHSSLRSGKAGVVVWPEHGIVHGVLFATAGHIVQ